MAGYKHIEHCVGSYIAAHYQHPVEVGIGNNPDAARQIHDAGILVRAVDIHPCLLPAGIPFARDDIFAPDVSLYAGADGIYAIRPAEEMIPPLIALAETIDCDLLVYHLGFESYGDGGEIVDCGVPLHYYRRRGQNPSKSVD
jgi:uncharacterized protein